MSVQIKEKLWCDLLQLRTCESEKQKVIGWTYNNSVFKAHFSTATIISNGLSAILLKSNYKMEIEDPNWSYVHLPFEGMQLFFNNSLDAGTLDMLKLYWPLSVIHHAERVKPFVIVHIASTLDGKIATLKGDSKWIGNDENLVHAHRVRALTDAVLVGAGTVKSDQPSLNVRHVKGENPIRLIISNKTNDFSAMKPVENSKTYLLRDSCYQYSSCDTIDEVIFYSGVNNEKRTNDLLLQLYKKGVKSILIEGGSQTISNIFSSKGLDVLQIHYAPIVLGSGKSIVDLPIINKISEATEFRNSFWTKVGDSSMITSGL